MKVIHVPRHKKVQNAMGFKQAAVKAGFRKGERLKQTWKMLQAYEGREAGPCLPGSDFHTVCSCKGCDCVCPRRQPYSPAPHDLLSHRDVNSRE